MTTDYHDFSHLDTPKEKRRKLNIGDIYINGAECLECGWFIRSKNRHHMISCKCGNVTVDGGSMYAKRSAKDFSKVKEVVVLYNDVEKEHEV